MQCKQFEEVLELNGIGSLPGNAREHLTTCAGCQDLLADFSAITLAAREMPAEVAPPDRLWVALQAQLESEGLIRQAQPAVIAAHPSRWRSISSFFRPRTLATAAVGIALIIAGALQIQKPSTPPVADTAKVQDPPAAAPPPALSVSRDKTLLPSPSEAASATLSQAELDVPNMQLAGNSTLDASLRQNLRTVNEFIADCELHVKQNPQDQLAREYLHAAYQQKAELLSAMMESGRSEH